MNDFLKLLLFEQYWLKDTICYFKILIVKDWHTISVIFAYNHCLSVVYILCSVWYLGRPGWLSGSSSVVQPVIHSVSL